MVGKSLPGDALPALVTAHERAMASGEPTEWARLAGEHRLPWEALPTGAMGEAAVWEAMLPHLGLTALVRNLGQMTKVGALRPLSSAEGIVLERLANREALRRARVHPFALLQALAVYRSGRGMRGAGSWEPVASVVAALDGAFHAAFGLVEPTGERHLLALDVSGSMGATLMGSPLTAREGSAAMAMATIAAEERTHVVGFTAGTSGRGIYGRQAELTPLPLRRGGTLEEALRVTSGLPFGGTDCALPMLHALKRGIPVDVFVVYTDSETWAGAVHPVEALRRYRQQTGIAAKLVVVGMTSGGFSIADPKDGGMLDVVGFDAAAPGVIADFVRGS